MLPGVTFTASRNYDYNSFLMENHWYEAGAKLSWNLMNLISGPTALNYANANEEVTKARRLALRMAVLAQVHVSERQFRNASSQYQQSDKLWKVDRRLAELSDAKAANDASGMLERVAGHASAIASQLRRFQTYAQVEQAYAKMQATMGDDLLPDSIKAEDLSDLSKLVAQRLTEWGQPKVAENSPSPQSAPEPIKSAEMAAPAPTPVPVEASPMAQEEPAITKKLEEAKEDSTIFKVFHFLEEGFTKSEAPVTKIAPASAQDAAYVDPQEGAVETVLSMVRSLSRPFGAAE
jgi:hypothetical protein